MIILSQTILHDSKHKTPQLFGNLLTNKMESSTLMIKLIINSSSNKSDI